MFMILLGVLLVWGGGNLTKWWGIFLIVILVMIILVPSIAIARQPESKRVLLFKVSCNC